MTVYYIRNIGINTLGHSGINACGDGSRTVVEARKRMLRKLSRSHRACPVECHTYHQLYNLNVTCLRFFTVYGPKQRPDLAINKFIKSIYKGEQINLFGNGQTSRDYTFVDDIVNGILAAINKCNGYSIFNLGNDSPTKLIDLVSAIAEITGCQPKINFTSKQAGDVESTWADISQSKNMLGYDPKISLIDGLRRQFEWLKNSKTRL